MLAEGFAQKLRAYLEQLPAPANWDVVCVGDMLGAPGCGGDGKPPFSAASASCRKTA